MSITPEQARELLDGATPSPWRFTECESIIPFRVDFWDDDEMGHKNADLAAAAPDLAQTIAALRWEYAVETMVEGEWEDIWDLWSAEKEARKEYADLIHDDEDGDYRLVRRLVGPVEVVEGE